MTRINVRTQELLEGIDTVTSLATMKENLSVRFDFDGNTLTLTGVGAVYKLLIEGMAFGSFLLPLQIATGLMKVHWESEVIQIELDATFLKFDHTKIMSAKIQSPLPPVSLLVGAGHVEILAAILKYSREQVSQTVGSEAVQTSEIALDDALSKAAAILKSFNVSKNILRDFVLKQIAL